MIPEPLDIAVFEEEINRLEREISELEEKIKKIDEGSNDLRRNFEQAQESYNALDEEKTKIVQEVNDAKVEYEQSRQDLSKCEESIKYYREKFNEIVAKEKVIEQKLGEERIALEVCFFFKSQFIQ